MARIAIIGPGAVGSAIAAWLMHTGRHEVVLCARRPLTSLVVETPGPTLRGEPAVLTRPGAASPADWVLVATKAYDAEGAGAWFPDLVGPRTPVVILQNGVEHRERFVRHVGADSILPVVVDLPAERTEPGRVRQRGRGLLTVADDERGRAFADLFAGTALEVALTADFRSAAWRKLCLNSAGVLNALLLQPSGVFRDDAVAALAGDIIRECIAVGRAEGAVLDDAIVESVLRSYRAAPPDGVNSLHADRLAGRPMELDARNGVIVRLGRQHGIATPCNAMAVTLLAAMTQPRTV